MNLVEFGKKTWTGQVCLSPYVSIAIDINGAVSLCGCSEWQPSTIGNIFDHTLSELLGNSAAQKIRSSIANGSYTYCNEQTCGIIKNGQLNDRNSVPPDVIPLLGNSDQWIMPREIVLAGDLTCNLSCPSCRNSVIRLEDQQRQRQQNLGSRLAANLFDTSSTEPINLTLSTSGEVFASSFLLDFVSAIDVDRFPNVNLRLQTNGLLAPRNWHRLGQCADRVSQLTVTFDAATPDTYHQLRRGGDWTSLVKSLEFLQQQRLSGMKLHTRMVVQQANWREMQQFYDFSRSYQADRVEYVRITDWGTYGPAFAKQDVFDARHPELQLAQAMLDTVSTLPKVWLGGDLHSNK